MKKFDRDKQIYHQRFTDKAKQILHGALPEFLQHGYTRTSMDKVARSAGVSKQTLYSYYSDKDGLFTALVEQIATNKFQLVWSQPLAGEPKQILKQIAQRIITEIEDEEYLNFVRLIVAESSTRPDLSQLFLNNLCKPATEILAQYFQTNQALNFSDPEATARIFIGSLIYFMLTQEVLHGKAIMPMESDRYVDNLIELILR
ncbi:transcriptional regulator, TetR family [Stanieria cyanosphaera PCC 7437]|uniref:Transcriptional regulator, TetR family n=1 Tax=Stanieria cyanosphaera (strain ATCC 29371 / PCC 7437) TaxID=111780 RepID=K9XSB6_STAC7|nr:TetR/AcrR family transcriptional regulator [Stanieria cyanosphaera]AFZ34956.1 transcriptional regulator, TetR family [Stanieria cyanosphaera PCC 7437]